jgi:hypothetical protein
MFLPFLRSAELIPVLVYIFQGSLLKDQNVDFLHFLVVVPSFRKGSFSHTPYILPWNTPMKRHIKLRRLIIMILKMSYFLAVFLLPYTTNDRLVAYCSWRCLDLMNFDWYDQLICQSKRYQATCNASARDGLGSFVHVNHMDFGGLSRVPTSVQNKNTTPLALLQKVFFCVLRGL